MKPSEMIDRLVKSYIADMSLEALQAFAHTYITDRLWDSTLPDLRNEYYDRFPSETEETPKDKEN
jgi:hypothetical protein